MSKKSARILALLRGVDDTGVDPRYAAYLDCFNRGLHFEAHEVLEELWLPQRSERDGDFYKGLIQLAGAFVHLQKNRLRPANALFALAEANLARYAPTHLRLDVAGVRRLIAGWRGQLTAGSFAVNPLDARLTPRLELLRAAAAPD